MPRTSGVSFSSVIRPILLSLRPISVSRCEWWRRIALPICSTLIVCAAFAERHARQVALGRFRRLADRLGHFARLAVAKTDPALLISDHDQRRKTEALAALDHLRHTIDVDQLVDELAVALFAIPAPV